MKEGSSKSLAIHSAFAALHSVVFSAMVGKQDISLQNQLVFYASYHQHPVNVAIHILFIPMIWWTIVIMMAHYPLLGLKLCLPFTSHRITWATSAFVGYAGYYVWLDHVVGSAFSVVLFVLYLAACRFARMSEEFQDSRVLKIAMFAQVLAWYMQIHPGHLVFEGVKPALVDSLGDALSVAPLFSFYDVIWYLMPSSDASSLQAQVSQGVALRRLDMCAANGALRFCSY